MSTVITRELNPESAWRDHALAALEEALGRPLSVWERDETSAWRAAAPTSDAPCALGQIAEMCDAAASRAAPACT